MRDKLISRLFHTVSFRLYGGGPGHQLRLHHLEKLSRSFLGMVLGPNFVATHISPQSSENGDINLRVFLGSSEEYRVPYLILTGSIRKSHEISSKQDMSKCEVAPEV